MPTGTIRIASANAACVERVRSAQLADWLSTVEPDAVVIAGEDTAAARRTLSRHVASATAILEPGRGGPGPEPVSLPGGEVISAPTAKALEAALSGRARDSDTEPGPTVDLDPDRESDDSTVVVTAALELSIDTTALSTTLHGREVLEAAPDRAGDLVVLSTGLPPDFRRTVGDATVVGAGDRPDTGEFELHHFDVGPNGRVLARTMRPDRLGLQALDQVGAKRADALERAGYDTRSAVAGASVAALQDLDGIGRSTATAIAASARAMVEGTVLRHSERPLPVADPLFVDIETDGLHPTVTWLIGVLDGSPNGGEYRFFLATEPDEPGAAVEAFLTWYESHAEGRPLVAYNGRSFDFPVLGDHVRTYRPSLTDVFERVPRFDPYHWAVSEDNASLPGRTNRLEDVATALGFEPATEGLTGAAVARRYRRFLADPGPETEPDWDRLVAYCEDDVRALAVVFRALETDEPAVSQRPTRQDRAETTQGTLSDW